jgi:DNA-binding beta-propeller fold protein YncE
MPRLAPRSPRSRRSSRPAIALLFASCAAGTDELAGAGDGDGPGGGARACAASNECPTGLVCTDFGRCEAPAPAGDAPPERELELGAPIGASRYVYVAMTGEDALARIDGQTLAVHTIPVGDAPREVAAIPGSDGAVVLDPVAGTATIVRPAGAGDAVRVLPMRPRLNRLTIDPAGRFAVIWRDLTREAPGSGAAGLQDVTVLRLAPGGERAVDLTVGFRPREVELDAAGARAYVITEDGVSVIDLALAVTTPPRLVPPIAVVPPGTPPQDVEVDIVPTGELAVVRRAGAASLRVVRVSGPASGTAVELPLASPGTDLDLAPDGSRAYVVERAARALAIVDLPTDGTLPGPGAVARVELGDFAAGSLALSPDGTRALLYTNATLDERLAVLRLDEPGRPLALWPLKKAVRAIAISPTGAAAVVLHAKAPGDPATAATIDEWIDRSHGYSLVDVATGFAKLELTPVAAGPLAYAPDGRRAYVAIDGGDAPGAPRALHTITAASGAIAERLLGSPPAAVGVLPAAGVAFAAQRHPRGRITFEHLTTGALRTVTGFALQRDVVE